ncbi:MAG: winged helix DNA-binding domain-containing protein [Peptococcaceae bacterium]|nr:winged helix DNA-binding domain-containing protein [Peptococcaceae bacterium]
MEFISAAERVISEGVISNQAARDFLIRHQRLHRRETATVANILDYFEQVGCVQYDPLDVVGRNPELVLQSRFAGFDRGLLSDMLYRERALIDAYDKEQAIVRATDWPLLRRLRTRGEVSQRDILAYRGQTRALEYVDLIQAEVVSRGPLFSREIKLELVNFGDNCRWGHKRLSGAVMEYLLVSGVLGVHHKKNTLRAYDLIERLLPAALLRAPDPFEDDEAFLLWYLKRRIGSVGMLWERQGGGWNGHYLRDNATRKRLLARLVGQGEIIPIRVEGIDDLLYVRNEDAALLERPVEYDGQIRVLAPLDNLIWDRGLTEKLFGFQYSWEVYLPVAKRKYGYYVLPVLYQNRIVARFEPAQQRGATALRIGKWWWEAGVKVTPALRRAAERGLALFAAYLGASEVERPPW